jgi:hypothetical protein
MSKTKIELTNGDLASKLKQIEQLREKFPERILIEGDEVFIKDFGVQDLEEAFVNNGDNLSGILAMNTNGRSFLWKDEDCEFTYMENTFFLDFADGRVIAESGAMPTSEWFTDKE